MRRVIAVLMLFGLAAFTAGTAVAGSSAVTQAPRGNAAKKIHCPKGKHAVKGKHGKRHCVKTRKSKPTATPALAAPNTATPTNTDTPTATPTATFTPTVTPTPSPSFASMVVRAGVAGGYRAGFFLCGLPLTSAASISPNPSISTSDPTSPTLASARTTLTVGVPFGIAPGTYDLNLYAYFEDPNGVQVQLPPGGVYLMPRGVTLTVDASGQASLSAGAFDPNVPQANCTDPPFGFLPSATATPSSQTVSVVAALSNARPSPGQLETVTGRITVNGQPVAGVPMHTNWYLSYGMQSCDAVSGADGTASCTIALRQFLPGQRYDVQVTFTLNGQNFTTFTSFYG